MKISQRLSSFMVIVVLVVVGFNAFNYFKLMDVNAKSSLAKDESLVFAMHAKNFQVASIQVQQWLTDISATRGAEGFDDGFALAEEFYQEGLGILDKFEEMFMEEQEDDMVNFIQSLKTEFTEFYEFGSKMAQNYIDNGPDQGNIDMALFDPIAEKLINSVDSLVGSQTNELDTAMMDIEKEGITRANAEDEFKKYVNLKDAVILDYTGKEKKSEDGVSAFDVDIKKEFRDKTLAEKDKNYPLFVAKDKAKNTRYIIPVVGKGLWGPIWGYICLKEDMTTILGVSFDHKSETPGLGAEINKPFFMDRWKSSKISDVQGNFMKYEVVKDNSGATKGDSKIDGITGGTITSKGVEEMVNRTLKIYATYFKNKKS